MVLKDILVVGYFVLFYGNRSWKFIIGLKSNDEFNGQSLKSKTNTLFHVITLLF